MLGVDDGVETHPLVEESETVTEISNLEVRQESKDGNVADDEEIDIVPKH